MVGHSSIKEYLAESLHTVNFGLDFGEDPLIQGTIDKYLNNHSPEKILVIG